MAAQMNYSFDTPKGVAGGKVDLAYDEVVTRQNEEANVRRLYGQGSGRWHHKGADRGRCSPCGEHGAGHVREGHSEKGCIGRHHA